MRISTTSLQASLVAFVVVQGSGCDIVPATNPFDEDTPRTLQAKGSLSGAIVLQGLDPDQVDLQFEDIAVHLVDGATGAKLLGADGAVLSAAIRRTADAPDRGAFELPGITPGTYRLDVEGVGSSLTIRPSLPFFVLAPGEAKDLGEIVYGRPLSQAGIGTVSGRVRLEGQQGGPRTVRLFRMTQDGPIEMKSVTTDADGRFALSEVDTGKYALSATLTGFTPDYAMDFEISDQEGQASTAAFDDDEALVLYPVTAVLIPALQQVEGAYYTSGDDAPMQVLAFGGVTGMRLATDPAFDDGNDGTLAFSTYAATAQVALPDQQGPIEIYAQFEARSTGGFVFTSDVFSATVVRDTIAPTIELVDAPGIVAADDETRYVTEAGAVIGLLIEVRDDESAVYGVAVDTDDTASPDANAFTTLFSTGGLTRVLGQTVTLQPLGDGPRSVYVWARDRAGNVTTPPAQLDFVVDTQAPQYALTVTNAANAVLQSRIAQLHLAAVGPDGGPSTDEDPVAMQIGKAPLLGSEPLLPFAADVVLPFSGSNGQSVTFAARLFDAAGNVGDVETEIVTLDLTATIEIENGAAVVADHDVDVTLVFPVDTAEYAVAEGALDCATASYQPATGAGTTLTDFPLSPGDGQKVVAACFRDAAGATLLALDDIVVDETLPSGSVVCTSCSFDAAGAAYTNDDPTPSVQLHVTAFDETLGVESVRVVVFDPIQGQDVETIIPNADDVTVALPDQDGAHVLHVTFIDGAGNESATTDLSITLDRDEPANGDLTVTGTIADDATSSSLTNNIGVELSPSATGATEMLLSNAIDFAGAVWQPYDPGPLPWLLSPGDGPKEVHVKFRDAAGNETQRVDGGLTLDTTAPEAPLALLAGGAGAIDDRVDVALFAFAVGATQIAISTDGAFDTAGEDFVAFDAQAQLTVDFDSVAFPTAGNLETVYVVFRDAAGNVSATATDSVLLDEVAPSGLGSDPAPTVTINDTGGFTSTEVVFIELRAYGAELMQISTDGLFDNEPVVAYAGSAVVALPGGDCPAVDCKTVQVIFSDAAGNAAATATASTTLDGTAPSLPLIATLPFTTSSTSVSIDLVAPVTETFFSHYEILGGPEAYPDGFDVVSPAVSTQTTFSVTIDSTSDTDPHTASVVNEVRIRAVDLAGNVSDEGSVTITNDGQKPAQPLLFVTKPEVNEDSVNVYLTRDDTSRFDATFDHYELRGGTFGQFTETSQLDGFTFSLQQGDGIACGPPDAGPAPIPCPNNLEVRAVDAAGNISDVGSVMVLEDSVAPTTPDITPSEATVNASRVSIRVTTPADDDSDFHYEVQTEEFDFADIGPPPWQIDLFEDHLNSIRVRAVDNAGNVGLEATADIDEVSTTKVISGIRDHTHPDVGGDLVVYERVKSGFSEIFSTNVRNDAETQLSTSGTAGKFSPRIASNRVVWESNSDVYTYNFLATPPITQVAVTNDTNTNREGSVDTDGKWVVFASGSPGTTCAGSTMKVWDTATTVCATTPANCKTIALPTGYTQWRSCPRVACNKIILTARNATQDDVLLFDASTQTQIANLTSAATFDGYAAGTTDTRARIDCETAAWTHSSSQIAYAKLLDSPPTVTVQTLNPTQTANTQGELAQTKFVYAGGNAGDGQDVYVKDLNAATSPSVPIDPLPLQQSTPSIDGERIVWEDRRDGVLGIYRHELYELKWVAVGPEAQQRPDVEQDHVGYYSVTIGGATQVADYALGAGVETLLTSTSPNATLDLGVSELPGIAYVSSSDAVRFTRASGDTSVVTGLSSFTGVTASSNLIVWNNGSALRKFDVNDSSNTQITTIGENTRPHVDQGLVTWVESNTVKCCSATSCASPSTISTGGGKTRKNPRVSQRTVVFGYGLVVWENATDARIEGRYVDSTTCTGFATGFFNTEFVVDPPPAGVEQANPAVGDRYIAYQDSRAGNWDIYLFDQRSKQSIQITDDPSGQINPEADRQVFVWEDYRFGNPDVFVLDLR